MLYLYFLYVVLTGKVQVVAEHETSVFLEPGDFFGGSPRSTGAQDSAAPALQPSSPPSPPAYSYSNGHSSTN